jgi:predicted branched-subunit amino acid permease
MKRVLSTSISVGLATGLYGVSFGALAAVAGLDLLSIMLLSILMFSGGSQFAFIGVLAGGGAPIAAITSSWLLGVRNGFYAMRLNSVVSPKGLMKVIAAQLSIDEIKWCFRRSVRPQVSALWLLGHRNRGIRFLESSDVTGSAGR